MPYEIWQTGFLEDFMKQSPSAHISGLLSEIEQYPMFYLLWCGFSFSFFLLCYAMLCCAVLENLFFDRYIVFAPKQQVRETYLQIRLGLKKKRTGSLNSRSIPVHLCVPNLSHSAQYTQVQYICDGLDRIFLLGNSFTP